MKKDTIVYCTVLYDQDCICHMKQGNKCHVQDLCALLLGFASDGLNYDQAVVFNTYSSLVNHPRVIFTPASVLA